VVRFSNLEVIRQMGDVLEQIVRVAQERRLRL
jgi:very-short-patch-repair endonuclease